MMENNVNIDWELLSKSFKGRLSPEEQTSLDEWLASSEHRRYYEKVRQGSETDPFTGLDRQILLEKRIELMARIGRKEGNMRKFWLGWVRYAAILLLPIALATVLWMQLGDKGTGVSEGNRIVAGGGQVVLELHDGRTYILDTARMVETGVEGNMAQAGKGKLVYPKQEATQLVHNKVIVPRGGEYQLQLADGSKVWLNSATEFSYPVAFTGETRVVYLTGEAYFEVAHDTKHPFIVMSGDMKVKVYGTRFNVNTHREGIIQTVLVQGKVGVSVISTGSETMLQPGQMAEFKMADKSVLLKETDTYPYTAWKDGEFVFQNETVEEILNRLCLWYDADVFYANEHVKQQRFTGVIKRFSAISDVLYLIGETATVNFTIQGRTIVVR